MPEDAAVKNREPQGQFVNLSLSGDGTAMKSLLLDDPGQGGNPRIRWVKGSRIDLKCVLYCKGHPDYATYADLSGTVTRSTTPDKKGKADAHDVLSFKGTVQLQKGSLRDGEWYIQTFFGLPNKDWDAAKHEFAMPRQVADGGAELSASIPVASPWTRLSINSDYSKAGAKLHFQPLGCIMSFTLSSPLYDSIPLTKIVMKNNMFDTEGRFQLGVVQNDAELDGGNGLPRWIPNGSDSAGFDMRHYTIPQNTQPGKDEVSPRIYFWAMPRQTNQGHDLQGYVFDSGDPTETGLETLPIKTNSGTSLQSGKTYRINLKLKPSDLMITEFFHYNPGGSNYSMIELYNPTNHDIDLRDYSLARERNVFNYSSSKGIPSRNCAGGFQADDSYNFLQQAVRQDLYIENDRQPVYSVGGQDISRWSWKNRYRVFYGTDTRYSPYLHPGKCIVLCAGGTLTRLNDGTSEDYPQEIVGNYILEAIEGGSCQYIMAVDNGSRENTYQSFRSGGTFQHGQKQVMVLLKGEKPIDTTGPCLYYEGKKGPNATDGNPDWTAVDGIPQPQPLAGATGKKIYDMYQIYQAFLSPGSFGADDRYDLIRKAYTRYPTMLWDNNKRGDDWDVDSQWILCKGKACGASMVSSLGTRTFNPGYVTQDVVNFLNRDENTYYWGNKKFYNYEVYPKSYDKSIPGRPDLLTGYSNVSF